MGNACFGKKRSSKGEVVVHPLDHHHHLHRLGDEEGVKRLKVRMTSGQLKELMAELKMDDSNKNLSDSELGRLVFRECLKGRLQARLVVRTSDGASDQSTFTSEKMWGLSTIQERSDDDDDDHS